MTINIDNASNDVNSVYKQIQPIVDSVVDKNAKSIDLIIEKIKRNLTDLTNKELRDLMLQLSIELYYFAHIKDMSILKQECAQTLLKEGIANVFNSSDGTQVIRSNQATIETLDKQTVSILYNAVSNNMKSKVDEAHRIINVLSNVLISKNAENKLKGVRDDDIHDNFNKDN